MSRSVLAAPVALTAGLLLFLGAFGGAQALPLVEMELDGTAVNNSTATAQAIPRSSFTTPVPPTVFDPPAHPTATITGAGGGGFPQSDVDFFSFSSGGGQVYLDIDNDPFTSFDTIVSLYDGAGNLIALGDETAADPGSPGPNGHDAFLGVFTLPGPGTFYVAVSEFPNYPAAFETCFIQPLTRPDGAFGGGVASFGCTPGDASFGVNDVQPVGALPYTLHLSLQNPVPEPSCLLLLGSTFTGWGLWRRIGGRRWPA